MGGDFSQLYSAQNSLLDARDRLNTLVAKDLEMQRAASTSPPAPSNPPPKPPRSRLPRSPRVTMSWIRQFLKNYQNLTVYHQNTKNIIGQRIGPTSRLREVHREARNRAKEKLAKLDFHLKFGLSPIYPFLEPVSKGFESHGFTCALSRLCSL